MKKPTCECIKNAVELPEYGLKLISITDEYFEYQCVDERNGEKKNDTGWLPANFCPQCGKEYK